MTAAGIAVILGAVAALGATAPPVPPNDQQAEFFETHVRPVLGTKCASCHGASQQMAGLRLDSRAAMLKGGGRGPALLPGDPEKSLLIRAVHYDAAPKMPPAGKLQEDEIAALTAWVKM